MDPDATLNDLLDAIGDGDYDTAHSLLTSLEHWSENGGFPPSDPRK